MTQVSDFWKAMGYPILLSNIDIAERNNVSRQAVWNWTKRYDFFPKEVMIVGENSGNPIPLYLLEDVELFERKKAELERSREADKGK